MKFINWFKIIILEQYRFLENHSTVLALTEVVEKNKKALEQGEYGLGIYIDLKKAFDTVDHKILLAKLEHYGFRGQANLLIKSYLSGRKQFTIINGVPSDINSIETGVPQGSVLGPLFFLLYMNDIVRCLNHEEATLFADDTSIFLHNKDLSILKKQAESCMIKLYDWFVSNKLSLNLQKSYFIIYHPKSKKISHHFDKIKFNNFEICRVKSVISWADTK